jgi:hypothetical protein
MAETKTTSAQEVWGSLARDAEERAERAAEAAREARATLRDLEGDRPLLAVAATEGDEEARERLAELDREIAEKRKEAEVAELARAESDRVAREHQEFAEEARERAEEAARRGRYDEIAREREAIEARATEAMLGLVESLDALSEVDYRQRVAAREAGVSDALNRSAWRLTTNNWIAGHLRDHAGDLPFRPEFRKPLSEFNPMPKRALTPDEKARLQEERAAALRERNAREERARAEFDRARDIDERRRALLAQTSHAQSPPHLKRDYERQVEAELAREFPGYEPQERLEGSLDGGA